MVSKAQELLEELAYDHSPKLYISIVLWLIAVAGIFFALFAMLFL